MSVRPPIRRFFSDERTLGTFQSLGVLPKRTADTYPDRSSAFHIAHNDDEHSPPLHLLSSESSSPQSSASAPSSTTPRSRSPSPQFARYASAPILLSNGKPLKPSLKCSSSTVSRRTHTHVRANSEPPAHKSVHFPVKDNALVSVRVFDCFARPAAVSHSANAHGDETETEGEDAFPARFPFPSLPPIIECEIDPTRSSPVPSTSSLPENVLLESLSLCSTSPTSATKASLVGSVLVRNLAFEKHVAIRFTLDDWNTVSEIGAHYVDSLSALPSKVLASPPSGDARGRGWDRFTFTILLEDYAPPSSACILWLAARYRIDSTYPEPGSSTHGPGGEWWDNNGGGNYSVAFRDTTANQPSTRGRLRLENITASISSSRTSLPPPLTCKEHASGLMVASIHTKERRLVPLRTRKLDLGNYVSLTSLPSASSPQTRSSSSICDAVLPPSNTLQSPSDEDSVSPASSTLSTPSASPTMLPRVIIGEQPSTSTHGSSDKDNDYVRPGYIEGWDWSATSKPQVEDPSGRHVSPVIASAPPGKNALSDSNALYEAFVTQWCFARGPSLDHHAYGDGIMT